MGCLLSLTVGGVDMWITYGKCILAHERNLEKVLGDVLHPIMARPNIGRNGFALRLADRDR